MKHLRLFLALLAFALSTGCAHKQPEAKLPPAPELPQPASSSVPAEPSAQPAADNSAESAEAELEKFADIKPLVVEIGLASWYGPPYHNRRGSNGEIYDMNAMTAAHRTLPLNSIVRVSNLRTGHSAVVRITDRGPFIGERVVDLSLAAAKAADVWAPGTAWVKLEVLETPMPIDSGGKWAVQIGAFTDANAAAKMKQDLLSRYGTAKVLQFAGPTGHWVRVRVQDDNRELAEEISRSVTAPEGGVFLVRLD